MQYAKKNLINVTASSGAALTDYGSAAATPILFDQTGPIGREHNLTLRVTGNGTADGGSKTVVLNVYFSDELISPVTDVPARLAGRKYSCTAVTMPNATSTLEGAYDTVFAFGTIKGKARYVYVSLTTSASLAASATLALSVDVVRQESGNRATR